MDDLIQQFEIPVAGRGGERYIAYVRGRSRADGKWEASIEFERVADGVRFSTEVETTQPDRQAILYWAAGLGRAFFQGALDRALRPRIKRGASPAAQPSAGSAIDSAGHATVRNHIARTILDRFRARAVPQLMMQELFDVLPFANADVVRAIEYLEKHERLVVRQTDRGNDLLMLTEQGLHVAGLAARPHRSERAILDRGKPKR